MSNPAEIGTSVSSVNVEEDVENLLAEKGIDEVFIAKAIAKRLEEILSVKGLVGYGRQKILADTLGVSGPYINRLLKVNDG